MRKDPLHVPYQDLVVYFKGEEKLILNKKLLDKQNCWENLNKIKHLHEERLNLENFLVKTIDCIRGLDTLPELEGFDTVPDTIKRLIDEWTEVQYKLQEAWGFPQDKKFHKFWEMEGCTCPKLDNNDGYPYGHYVYSGGCPIHKHLLGG